MRRIRTIEWAGDFVRLMDQTRLPSETTYLEVRSAEEMAECIREMRIRGAPALGVAAAMGVALAAWGSRNAGRSEMARAVAYADSVLRASRPTARNLFWALTRMAQLWGRVKDDLEPAAAAEKLVEEAKRIHLEDLEISRRIGANGAGLFAGQTRALTHCNAGGLATGGGGTALAVLAEAHRRGLIEKVYVDETRPLLQGARLTAWELEQLGVPACLICDATAAWVMKVKGVRAVVVGADRVAANGDVANKVGTYGLALAARRHGAQFVVAAPTTTLDPETATGEEIPIEERSGAEVKGFGGMIWAPEGVKTFNPAFDVTPAELVSAIVTERGVLRPPFEGKIERAVRDAEC